MMTINRLSILTMLLLLLVMLAACGSPAGEVAQRAQPESTAMAEASTAGEEALTEAAAATTEPPTGTEEEAIPPEKSAEEAQVTATGVPVETAVSDPESLPPDPVEVTFFTPSQQEGPYYTVDKPADRDNDLVTLTGAAASPAGEVLEFGGTVYDAGGRAIEGAVIEIWQTDAAGVYDHPNDPGTESRDRGFQFYGETRTDENGKYMFRTVLPGLYEPRPRHIHVKVRLGGQEVLTTQFYFAGEIEFQGAEALMLIDVQPAIDDDGNAIMVGERDIFLNVDGNGG